MSVQKSVTQPTASRWRSVFDMLDTAHARPVQGELIAK